MVQPSDPHVSARRLALADLTPAQRAAVTTLLTTALSRDGYRKVTEIMHGDEVLRTRQGGGAPEQAAVAVVRAAVGAAPHSAKTSITSPS